MGNTTRLAENTVFYEDLPPVDFCVASLIPHSLCNTVTEATSNLSAHILKWCSLYDTTPAET